MTFLVRLLVNAAALFVAAWLVPGIRHDGSLIGLLIVALLFGLVVNALMLMLTGWLSGQLGLGFHVNGFWSAFFGGLIVGLVSLALSLVIHEDEKHD